MLVCSVGYLLDDVVYTGVLETIITAKSSFSVYLIKSAKNYIVVSSGHYYNEISQLYFLLSTPMEFN